MFTAAILLSDTVCNGNCQYCYAGYNQGHPIRRINPDLEKFKTELRNFYEVDRKNVGDEASFEIWGGEPTINPWLVPTCEAINEVFREFNKTPSITVVTNGYELIKASQIVPSNVKFQISNDMSFQSTTRGKQPMEDEEWSKAVKDLYEKKQLSGFQSVITPETQDVLSMYQYFLDWETKYDIDVSWGMMVCKSYGKEGTEHLFNQDNCGVLREGISLILREILSHQEQGINLKLDQRLLEKLFLNSLPQLTDTSGYGGRVHYPCTTFSRRAAIGIDGSRWACPHDYELGMTSEESLKRCEEYYEKCASCTYHWICRGICSGITRAEKEKNCENLWVFYSSFRRAILEILPPEYMEKIEDAQIIQSFRYQWN